MIILTPSNLKDLKRSIDTVESLLETGMHRLHLRMLDASESAYRQILNNIDPSLHKQIVLCDYYSLLSDYDVGGLYLPYRRLPEWDDLDVAPHQTVSIGAHSIRELKGLPFTPDYALLSPLFDSISKAGYRGNPELLSCQEALRSLRYPVYALGGITPDKETQIIEAGYSGVAILGDLWNQKENKRLERLTLYQEPAILSVAGHDPTSGAGVGMDTRIANKLGVQCYNAITGLTVQSLNQFTSIIPTASSLLREVLTTLLTDHPVSVAKVGMVQDLGQACDIVTQLRSLGTKRIIWDPILHPSVAKETDADLWQKSDDLSSLLEMVDLVTPNTDEAQTLFGADSPIDLQQIARNKGCAILLKGGHEHSSPYLVVNRLITSEDIYPFYAHRYSKSLHGTGCMLSAAIASYWAMNNNLVGSVQRACHKLSTIFAQQPNRSGYQLLTTNQQIPSRLYRYLDGAIRLQYVTNESSPESLYNKVSQYLKAGGRWVQLRLKGASTIERTKIGLQLRTITERYNACLIIDDDIMATIAVKADGVHLGKQDCPPQEARRILGDDYIIGYTVNSIEDLPTALAADIDYIGVGPYKDTRTKDLLAPILGAEGVADIAYQVKQLDQGLRIPRIVAIGGIKPEDATLLLKDSNIDGIAVSGAIENSRDIPQTVEKFLVDRVLLF